MMNFQFYMQVILNDPETTLQDKELKKSNKKALGILNQREAMVAQLYYVEELNIYEISEVLEISTGRISQIKKSIIEKLRNEISLNKNNNWREIDKIILLVNNIEINYATGLSLELAVVLKIFLKVDVILKY